MVRAPSRSRSGLPTRSATSTSTSSSRSSLPKRLRIAPEAVEANEDAERTLGERLLTSLERATPELAEASAAEPFDEELLRAVQDAVRDYASRGNAVIVGRGAAAILGAARRRAARLHARAAARGASQHVVETMHVRKSWPRPRSIASIELASPTCASGMA